MSTCPCQVLDVCVLVLGLDVLLSGGMSQLLGPDRPSQGPFLSCRCLLYVFFSAKVINLVYMSLERPASRPDISVVIASLMRAQSYLCMCYCYLLR